MDIYLIRHGECFRSTAEYYDIIKNTMNPPLTEKGVFQAQKLADRLSAVRFDRIYTSDLTRSLNTAMLINEKICSEIIITPQFREIDMGDIYIKSWNDYPDIYDMWNRHKDDIPYPKGKNGADVWKRCKQEIDSIITSSYERVAIVCHGGTIRSIVCGILDIPQQKRFFFGYPPENCSVSIVKYQNSQFYLHTFNDYSHI